MALEITYAEVKFKDTLLPVEAKAPPEKSTPQREPCKPKLWVPWLVSALLLLLCVALIITLIEQFWTCCPMGWKPFRANCYYLSSDSMSWDESEKNCTGMGSHLVVINTQAEQDFLLSWTKTIFSSRRSYFIGLSAQEVEAQWCWVDQTPYNKTATFWKPGEPSSPKTEQCTSFQMGHHAHIRVIFLSQWPCNCKLKVMLHKQSPKAHKLPETFPEWRCALGTPGSKEWVWTCCPMGWKPFRVNCYYLSSDSMSGDESEKNCTGMGSHLVVINTQAEQDFLLNWTKDIFSSRRTYFIGLSAQEVEAQWRWVDQTPYNKTAAFWKPGEPRIPKMEKYTSFQVHSRTQARQNWNDIPCSTSLNRICEAAAAFI
ncbi:C-type lectin domain family 4 member A [Alligator mississippiensis]|uniref:C-type lectin domain family 4 member A n=1 Tax=Alligator mississippiensis TaxID=8496 RepID=A0A151P6I5_ALLMI|nr:C-type lectin domain family 4 member A [Alligator mississippiensis]